MKFLTVPSKSGGGASCFRLDAPYQYKLSNITSNVFVDNISVIEHPEVNFHNIYLCLSSYKSNHQSKILSNRCIQNYVFKINLHGRLNCATLGIFFPLYGDTFRIILPTEMQRQVGSGQVDPHKFFFKKNTDWYFCYFDFQTKPILTTYDNKK